MNYDELVLSNDNALTRRMKVPIGALCRRQTDNGLVNVLELRENLSEDLHFRESLREECEGILKLSNAHQIHFVPLSSDGIPTSLEVEQGSYMTFEQLLSDTPAVVAKSGFVTDTINALLTYVSYLHEQGIYHVCFAPSNVFVRKSDFSVMLLSHGSYYLRMKNPALLYEGVDEYVAPEVMSKGVVDERCDVYSIGKFLEYFFSVAEISYEYKKVIRKATSIIPEDRYQTVDDMLRAIGVKRGVKRTFRTMIVAVVLALLCVGAFFELMPNTEPVEYVTPAPKQEVDDLLDKGFDPTTELGVVTNDTIEMTPEERERMRQYEEKCESIFRKMYTKEADRILSKIYNKEYMGNNEKKFIAGSQSVFDELLKAQMEIAAQADISPARSREIAAGIIETVTEQKKKALSGGYGVQK